MRRLIIKIISKCVKTILKNKHEEFLMRLVQYLIHNFKTKIQ